MESAATVGIRKGPNSEQLVILPKREIWKNRGCSVGAWNIEEELIVSGWMAMQYYTAETINLDSLGFTISTYPYSNFPVHKAGFKISEEE